MDPLCAALARLKALEVSVEEVAQEFKHIFRFRQAYPKDDTELPETLREIRGTRNIVRFFELSFHEEFDATQHPSQIITREDVITALRKRLRGEITSDELAAWASFLLMFPVYDFECDEEDEIVETATHETLDMLWCPEADGELTDARVKYYLDCLEANRSP